MCHMDTVAVLVEHEAVIPTMLTIEVDVRKYVEATFDSEGLN